MAIILWQSFVCLGCPGGFCITSRPLSRLSVSLATPSSLELAKSCFALEMPQCFLDASIRSARILKGTNAVVIGKAGAAACCWRCPCNSSCFPWKSCTWLCSSWLAHANFCKVSCIEFSLSLPGCVNHRGETTSCRFSFHFRKTSHLSQYPFGLRSSVLVLVNIDREHERQRTFGSF